MSGTINLLEVDITAFYREATSKTGSRQTSEKLIIKKKKTFNHKLEAQNHNYM